MPMTLPPALDLSLDLLRCPTCRTRHLRPDHGALRCPVGHAFDIARHGYAGRLVVIRPTGRHLAELRGRVPAMVTVDPAKEQRLHRALNPFFEAVVTEQVEYLAVLSRPDVLDLVAMTPSARHVSRADLDEDGLLPDRVTVSVLATAYRPR
ncbi:putative RNA methyltransferase [Streptomyces hydrogenans]|uniref:putative RNA methyltransferase n=1 Tax=Streptomyces hydrogenans TaxID=1873719 RepID=UPI003642ECE7